MNAIDAATSDLEVSVLEAVAHFTAAHLGLQFHGPNLADLARGLRHIAQDRHSGSVAEAAAWLLTPPVTMEKLDALAQTVTVGETYFFREPAAFDALARHVLPEILGQRRTSGLRSLRLWSAGCATGEEPYSLAMTLEQVIPDLDSWDVLLSATDINTQFLRTAERALYPPWSFRGVTPEIRRKFFTPAGKALEVAPRPRGRVRFSQLNLAGDISSSPSAVTYGFDVIFCRNVLMYFGPSRASAVVHRLANALLPGGWLVVGATEHSTALFKDFETVNFGEAIFYRKRSLETAKANKRPFNNAPRRDALKVHPRRSPNPMLPPMADVLHAEDVRTLVRRARAAADRGALDEAALWTSRAIAADKTDADLHYLDAEISLERGNAAAAATALDRAILIRPRFALAHYLRATLAQADGRSRRARRHFANALAALKDCKPDEAVDVAQGLTVAHLTEMIHAAAGRLPP